MRTVINTSLEQNETECVLIQHWSSLTLNLTVINVNFFLLLLVFALPVPFPLPAAPLKVGDHFFYTFSFFSFFSLTTASSDFVVRNTKCEIRFYWGGTRCEIRAQGEKCDPLTVFIILLLKLKPRSSWSKTKSHFIWFQSNMKKIFSWDQNKFLYKDIYRVHLLDF